MRTTFAAFQPHIIDLGHYLLPEYKRHLENTIKYQTPNNRILCPKKQHGVYVLVSTGKAGTATSLDEKTPAVPRLPIIKKIAPKIFYIRKVSLVRPTQEGSFEKLSSLARVKY